jgi:hypothetical protein
MIVEATMDEKEFQEEMKGLIDEEGLIQPKVPTPEDEAQERHEQLMHRLRGIEKRLTEMDWEISRRTKEIYEIITGAIVIVGIGYLLQTTLSEQVLKWLAWLILVCLLGFLIIRWTWRKLRMWFRVQQAKPDAWNFRVGDRVSVWQGQDGYGNKAGSKGTVTGIDEGAVFVKWDNGRLGTYWGFFNKKDFYNLEKLPAEPNAKRR